MNDTDRHNLVSNIEASMHGITGDKREMIINRQVSHFFSADVNLGIAVAKGLGMNTDKMMGESN